jgi:hypothetical protein
MDDTITSGRTCKHSSGVGQVDNGTQEFGSEITLRGLFEAGSVSSAAPPPMEELARIDGETYYGWEGAVRSKQSGAQAPGGDSDSGLVICLCFEGGPGTVGTVKVSSGRWTGCLHFPRSMSSASADSSSSHTPHCRTSDEEEF